MSIKITTLTDMQNFAAEIARSVRGGDVIGLVGDLGAGKTTFTQMLASELGVREEVKSPTFVILREYVTGAEAAARGVRKLVHADAYRLDNEDELWGIGFDELASDTEAVTVVEWADKVPSLSDYSGYRELKFGFGEEGRRIVEE